MSNLRSMLGKWVTTEITESIRLQYGDAVANDLAEIMRCEIARLQSDQMITRMAANIRNIQIDREKMQSLYITPPREDEEVL